MEQAIRFYRNQTPLVQKLIEYVGLSIPIILFCLGLLLTGNRLTAGDADYLMQLQEAARRSVFEFHQFPWWNPWVSGGVPLFANPQFGFFSLTTIFTFTFGSIFGYKLALTAYFLVGFWGFLYLFRRALKTPVVTAILLSYVWTFGSFLVQRSSGHYTFFTIQFFPIILALFLRRTELKRAWLWLGFALAIMSNTASHNMTVLSFAVLGLFALTELLSVSYKYVRQKKFDVSVSVNFKDVYFWLKTAGVFLVFAGYRLIFALQFLREYPRELVIPEGSIGVPKALLAVFGPFLQFENAPSAPPWSWLEASAYIGILTGVVATLCFILLIQKRGGKSRSKDSRLSPWLPIVLGCIFFLLSLGTFLGKLSPYSILKMLPVFSDMRVAPRWLTWVAIMILLFIGLYRDKKWRKAINILLLISVAELFITNRPYLAKPYVIDAANYKTSAVINQQIHYDIQRYGIPYDENLTAATKANIGQVVAGDALLDTRWGPPWGIGTTHCDSDSANCSFVETGNAKVVYWSPNLIKLERTAKGKIVLNMNPGKDWLVNDRYIFGDMRLAEPNKQFVITDTSNSIVLKLQPKLSPEWFWWKLTN